MRVKSNKALRRSARLARRAPISPVVALPAATSFPRRPWLRVGAANGVAAAVAGILWGSGGAAYAQEQAGAATPAAESLQEIVVTASAVGVKKLDASYNIVAVDAEQIKEANPKSTADILKVSPGIWPESSGGQTGANIEEVAHQRAFTTLPAMNAELEMEVQTRGPEHIEQVLQALRAAGLPAQLYSS